MAIVKGVSFPNHKKHLLDYAESKENFSKYVIHLIEEDVSKKSENLSKEKISAIISNIQSQLMEIKDIL